MNQLSALPMSVDKWPLRDIVWERDRNAEKRLEDKIFTNFFRKIPTAGGISTWKERKYELSN